MIGADVEVALVPWSVLRERWCAWEAYRATGGVAIEADDEQAHA